MSFVRVQTTEEYEAAASLFQQYAQAIGIDLSFQQFDTELAELPKMYGPPAGCIILYRQEEVFRGCIALRKIDDTTAEVKRMYVQPGVQGGGIGRQLLLLVLEAAVEMGYQKVRLDTLNHMAPAIHLYTSLGFYPISPYNYNPHSTVLYFEKILA